MTVQTSSTPEHQVNVAMIGCIDDRMHEADVSTVANEGRGFLVKMAGGGLSILNPRDQAAVLGQFTDAMIFAPYNLVIVQVHLGCAKAGQLATCADFPHKFNPNSELDMLELGVKAASKVRDELTRTLGVEVPASVELVRIITGKSSKPTTELIRCTPVNG
ncbi:MAG: hypothetical protein PVI21_04165 [Candidatus Woesebacteria bacterium]